jgi:DNA-binding NtrC family response regulator
MDSASSSPPAVVGIYGSIDFSRRVSAAITAADSSVRCMPALLAEAWSNILTNRPSIVVFELGLAYSDRSHVSLRSLLGELRARFGTSIYTIAALTDPQKLFFGGDLLYGLEREFTPSLWIDSFIASPPSIMGTVPSVFEQAVHAVRLAAGEMLRRENGSIPLPPLGAPGWAQSLAAPKSRELWMRWLPRYASYTNENPIIIGQTGTGKTNLAYALHLLSGRKGQFISITPRDFSSSELVQAELFGAVAGAYTGAVDKWGLVKSAEKGTLFIDELQSIDKDLQGKLITFIENKAYRRVGSAESTAADVRFVFASNRELYDMMDSDILRHDFAYRLERVQLDLLPLQQRRLDIAAALAHALAKVRRQRPSALQVFGLNQTAYRLLFSHGWPGNLRQLENTVAQLCELSDLEGASIVTEEMVAAVFEHRSRGLSLTVSDVVSQAAAELSRQALHGKAANVEASLDSFIELIRTGAVEACGGDISKASNLLGEDKKLLELMNHSQAAKRELLLRRIAPKNSKGAA